MAQQVGRPRWIRLAGWKDGASLAALPALREALQHVHGFCTGAHAVANRALTVEFEIAGQHIARFRDELERVGVHLSHESWLRLRELAGEVDGHEEVDGTLCVELL